MGQGPPPKASDSGGLGGSPEVSSFEKVTASVMICYIVGTRKWVLDLFVSGGGIGKSGQ